MNCLLVVSVLVVFTSASASVIGGIALAGPIAPGAVLKGPAAEATLAGPDGSAISAAAQAGAVAVPPRGAGVISAAISPGLVGVTAPIATISGLATPLTAVAAPAGALLAGPAGTVIANNGIAGLTTTGILAKDALLAAPALSVGLGGKLLI